MKTFTIENETNNITLHASGKEAELVPDSERFTNEAALAKLAADWPAARLVEIWNGLPGATSVQKFKDRATGVSRIWKALQSLALDVTGAEVETAPIEEGAIQPEVVISDTPEADVPAPVAPQTADVAPEEAPAKTKATRPKKAPKAATNTGVPREGSKTSQVIAMLKREGGATLEDIVTAMGWQKHTTRSMLSAGGSLAKNHGLVITSEKVGDKRVYSIKA